MSKVIPQSAMSALRSRSLSSLPRICVCSASTKRAPIAPKSPGAWQESSLNSRQIENLVRDGHRRRHTQSVGVAFFVHQADIGKAEPACGLELGLVDDDVLVERFADKPDHQA